MNFEAIDKMSSDKVLVLLHQVENSKATLHYLKLTRSVIDAFLNKNLKVSTRIYLLWKTVFFLRLWRQWLKENHYSIQKDFITFNTYTCIELNAHALLLLIEKCKESGLPLLPWLYSSQPCEKIFRQTRAMTSTFSTVVKFCMLDILRRLTRIQCINEINTDLSMRIIIFISFVIIEPLISEHAYCFPREENRRLGHTEIRETSAKEVVSMSREEI